MPKYIYQLSDDFSLKKYITPARFLCMYIWLKNQMTDENPIG
jgi:hypothetical protein